MTSFYVPFFFICNNFVPGNKLGNYVSGLENRCLYIDFFKTVLHVYMCNYLKWIQLAYIKRNVSLKT